jgi:hypothetical protein
MLPDVGKICSGGSFLGKQIARLSPNAEIEPDTLGSAGLLLQRRLAADRPRSPPAHSKNATPSQVENLRYSRLQACATGRHP